MTSQINPNNIDGNYPVAGISNNTQGMRDNFTNTKTNFQYAADEITELQQKAVLKTAVTGSTLDNNMNDNVLYAVQLRDVSYTLINVATTSGTVTLDYAAGMYQQVNTTGNISLGFTNWPTAGTIGTLRIGINITNANYTVTLPASVSQGLIGLEGISPGTPGVTNTITFNQVGNFVFEFVTPDAGETIYIFDETRPRVRFTAPVTITANAQSSSTNTGALTIAGGLGVAGNLYVGGNIVGSVTITGVNVPGDVLAGGRVSAAGNVISSANVIAGNVLSSGRVSAAGNVIGANINGVNLSLSGNVLNGLNSTANIVTTANISAGNSVITNTVTGGNVRSLGFVSAIGDIIGGDIKTNGTVSAFGTITGGNISTVGAVGAGSASVTGTITGGNLITAGVISATGSITSSGATAGVGYRTGAGGTVTQLTSKSTPVTLNAVSGEITMNGALLGGDATVSFVMTNSSIANADVLILNHVGGGNVGEYALNGVCNTGNATIYVHNMTNTNRSDPIVLRFAVIKGATS